MNKITYKLSVRSDHFENETTKRKYVLNRFGSDAAGHMLPPKKIKNKNISIENILKILTAIYEDSEKKNNMKNFFHNLKMNSNKKFIDFYSEYMRLIARTEYFEFRFIEYLKRKLVTRLAIELFYCFQITKFIEMKTIYIRVDNGHRLTAKNKNI